MAAWWAALLLLYAGFAAAQKTTTTSTHTVLTLTTTIAGGRTTHATTQALTPTSAWANPGMKPTAAVSGGPGGWDGHDFKSAVMNSTNYWRHQYEAKPVSWNDTLAEYAQTHSKHCIWKHSGGPYGENIAEGFGSPMLAIDAWGNEVKNYNFAKGDFSESTGHFTQLVWLNTKQVGCGAVKCDNNGEDGAHGWYLVCEYYPPGNVVGAFQQNVVNPGDNNGKLGLGGAPRMGDLSRTMLALAAVSLFAVMWL